MAMWSRQCSLPIHAELGDQSLDADLFHEGELGQILQALGPGVFGQCCQLSGLLFEGQNVALDGAEDLSQVLSQFGRTITSLPWDPSVLMVSGHRTTEETWFH
jgi:hypothetical protein